MLYYDRIDISDDIDVNETSTSKESIICYLSIFRIKIFGFNQLSAMVAISY